MAKVAKLTIQQWGTSLAVRLPCAGARRLASRLDSRLEVVLKEAGVLVKPIGKPKLTLAQKLALFDPVEHGGEVMGGNIASAAASSLTPMTS